MFENLYRIVTGERSTVTPCPQPSAPAAPSKAVKVRFVHDIQALRDAGFTLSAGSTIDMTLRDALALMPRDRRRIDAYTPLCRYLLAEFGTELTIVSNKTKTKSA